MSPEFFEDVASDPSAARERRRFRIVLAGSLESFNGVELALESMSHLPDGYELVVAGKGTIAPAVEVAAARDDRIVYRGVLEFDQLLELYRSADLLLNLRVTRAIDTRYFFPSKLMELLASGTPVLSTCTGHVEGEFGGVIYLLREETAGAVADRVLHRRDARRRTSRPRRESAGLHADREILEKTGRASPSTFAPSSSSGTCGKRTGGRAQVKNRYFSSPTWWFS